MGQYVLVVQEMDCSQFLPTENYSWNGRRGPWWPRHGGHRLPSNPPRCPRPPRLPHCHFAMSLLLLDDVELGQTSVFESPLLASTAQQQLKSRSYTHGGMLLIVNLSPTGGTIM
eukprot:6630285-Prymnesium_polylepis.1